MSAIGESLTFPQSKFTTVVDALTLIPRIIAVVGCTLAVMPIFCIASFLYRSDLSDPLEITNGKTPILLIHGSGSNPRQWEVFRRCIAGDRCGHIFAVALNDARFTNDEKSIAEYAQERVAAKVAEIRSRYLAAGLKPNGVILAGHSIGGMVAAQYALNHTDEVKVKAVIAFNIPWAGSSVADWTCDLDDRPAGAFVTTNPDSKKLREALVEKERAGDLNIYTVSGTLDEFVSPSSSSLPIRSDRQICSKWCDHYTASFNPFLARWIRDEWIVPNTSDLEATLS